jgi:hypothetical protein
MPLGHWKARPRPGKLILGGGNAGFGVTVPTRKAGMKVAMVEERDLGGTCPNRGCTPKKVLVAAGHALHEIGQAQVHKISVSKPKLDWAGLINREKEMISGIPGIPRRDARGARRRSLPGQRQLRRTECGQGRQPHHRGKAYRHRHRLEAEAAAH